MSLIILNKKDLEKAEARVLAPYAVLSSKSLGRQFPETEDRTRTVFQRDRDRIIHCKPFRRLSGKTQVFVATYGDHFRDRLTHTLEAAQIARGIACNLRLNEDLCEVIALAHDLGHTPFGHAGEIALNEIMQGFSLHFEHNEQSKRIVEKLEKQFPDFDGLNLTHEVRQGLAKHQTIYDQHGKEIAGKTLEAQVVDIADEIAYSNHDLDDGIRSGIFKLKDLKKLALWNEALDAVQKKYGTVSDPVVLRHRTVSHIVSMMIKDVIDTSAKNILDRHIASAEDVLKQTAGIVCFSAQFRKKATDLRKFLWKNLYNSKQVLRHSRRGQTLLKRMFWKLHEKPKLMPKSFWERINAPEPLEVVVKDYVAGCTDIYVNYVLRINRL